MRDAGTGLSKDHEGSSEAKPGPMQAYDVFAGKRFVSSPISALVDSAASVAKGGERPFAAGGTNGG